MAMLLIDYLIGYYKNMAKNKIVKNIKNESIKPILSMDEHKINHSTNAPVTSETVANGTHKNNRGRFSGMSISDFQNFVFLCNVHDMRTNSEIVTVLTIEHPRSSVVLRNGGTFPIKLIDGMRTLYNRGKHGNPIPQTLSPKFIIDENQKRVIDKKWNTKNNPTKNVTATINK